MSCIQPILTNHLFCAWWWEYNAFLDTDHVSPTGPKTVSAAKRHIVLNETMGWGCNPLRDVRKVLSENEVQAEIRKQDGGRRVPDEGKGMRCVWRTGKRQRGWGTVPGRGRGYSVGRSQEVVLGVSLSKGQGKLLQCLFLGWRGLFEPPTCSQSEAQVTWTCAWDLSPLPAEPDALCG